MIATIILTTGHEFEVDAAHTAELHNIQEQLEAFEQVRISLTDKQSVVIRSELIAAVLFEE